MRVYCRQGCCELEILPYIARENVRWSQLPKRYKAGVFVNETTTGKILVVQSRGKLWGPPKGGIEPSETRAQAAVRELREETGMVLPHHSLHSKQSTRLKTRTVYYHVQLPEPVPVAVQSLLGNDANGVGWIRPNCLLQLAKDGRLQLTAHLQRLLRDV